jgi:N-acetyl sugar amidotransferase
MTSENRTSTSVYRVCTRCVMDTTDPEITFDANGTCNHCLNFDTVVRQHWLPNQEGKRKLEQIVSEIKSQGRDKPYDCVLGLSGGVDSSYLALQARQWGLRPLAVHVDTGWNRDVGVSNIEALVKALKIDLATVVVDWDEMRDLQVAYLRAGVENQDTPQDHAIIAGLLRTAVRNKIPYVLSGANYSTESVLPTAWGHDAMDLRQLKAIHRRFGTRKLRSYPTLNFFQYRIWLQYMQQMRVVDMLNYIPYDRKMAIGSLKRDVGFREYGDKHFESQFTKFFQGYYLPRKFGYDKRRAHLASMVLSGQLTREVALGLLANSEYSDEDLRRDHEYISKKLELSESEFDAILSAPRHSYRDYPTSLTLHRRMSRVKQLLAFGLQKTRNKALEEA